MDLIDRLRRVTLFQNLLLDDLKLVAGLCEEHVVPAGTCLVRQADLGANFFLIDRGQAVIQRVDEQGHQRPVGQLKEGDYFGITSLFLGEPRDATVTAITEMRFWTIPRDGFQALLDAYPDIERALLIPESVLQKLRAPYYPWQETGEYVIHHCRRHWLVFAQSALLSTLAMWGYIFLIIGVSLVGRVTLTTIWVTLIIFIVYILGMLWHSINWFNDYFVVTNRRVTHNEQVAFLYEARIEAPLDRVQNTSTEIDFWGRVFRYGTVTIQTAAEGGRMVFDRIPQPERMSEAIMKELSRARAIYRATQRYRIREELAMHLNLRDGRTAPQASIIGEQPISAIPKVSVAHVRPGRLAQAVLWLSEMGALPRMRIDKPDSITWRKHVIFLIVRVLPSFILSILFGFASVLGFFGYPHAAVSILPPYPLILFGITIVCMGWFWWEAADWSNDLYILTDERIIDTAKRPLFFAEQRREANLDRIQNVSFKIPNILAVAFNFGDVLIQTAGAGDLTFDGIPSPREVQREIFRRMEAYRERLREAEAARRRSEMAEWFSVYDELDRERRQGAAQSQGPS